MLTVEQAIALVGSAATLLTALVTLMVVVEMKNQRRSSHRPELVIPVANLFGDFASILVQLENSLHEGMVSVINVGLAAAVNIDVRWTYSQDEFLRELHETVKVDEGFEDKIIDRLMVDGARASPRRVCDYLMPVAVANMNNEVMLVIPTSFITLVQRWIAEHESGNWGMRIGVTFKCDLHYEDVESNHYETLHQFGIRVNKKGSGELEQFHVRVFPEVRRTSKKLTKMIGKRKYWLLD